MSPVCAENNRSFNVGSSNKKLKSFEKMLLILANVDKLNVILRREK